MLIDIQKQTTVPFCKPLYYISHPYLRVQQEFKAGIYMFLLCLECCLINLYLLDCHNLLKYTLLLFSMILTGIFLYSVTQSNLVH